MADPLMDGFDGRHRRGAGDTRFRRDEMDDLMERRSRFHGRFADARRRRFGHSNLVPGEMLGPCRDVALAAVMAGRRRRFMRGTMVGGDLPFDSAGIALAEEKLRQGKRRAESFEDAIIDTDSGAAMTADDDLRLGRRDEQRA